MANNRDSAERRSEGTSRAYVRLEKMRKAVNRERNLPNSHNRRPPATASAPMAPSMVPHQSHHGPLPANVPPTALFSVSARNASSHGHPDMRLAGTAPPRHLANHFAFPGFVPLSAADHARMYRGPPMAFTDENYPGNGISSMDLVRGSHPSLHFGKVYHATSDMSVY